MNTKKDCCSLCLKLLRQYVGSIFTGRCICGGNISKQEEKSECCAGCLVTFITKPAFCANPEHSCHTDSTKKESFSDFFHNASPEEKERVMLEIAREATNDQRAQIGLPPLHTSPEKEIDPNQMMHDLHEEVDRISHVKEPSEEMKAKLKKGAEMFKRDHGEQFNELAKETEPSFTEKTLNLFREKFVRDDGLMDKYYTYGGGEPGDHTAFMADAIEEFFEDKLKESAENERSRILALIESKKHKTCEMEREVKESIYALGFGPGMKKGDKYTYQSSLTDEEIAHNAALTSLAEELKRPQPPQK